MIGRAVAALLVDRLFRWSARHGRRSSAVVTRYRQHHHWPPEQTGENRYLFSHDVEMMLGDATLYADLVEVFLDKDLMVATGNVTIVQTTNRMSAERAEFNFKTKLGTFWGAVGFATIKPEAPRPGAFAPPPVSGQDTDVYFQGDIVEKIGGRRFQDYKGRLHDVHLQDRRRAGGSLPTRSS